MTDQPDATRRAVEHDHLVALPAGTLLGKYRLDAVLGHGGFGITYKAFDTALDRSVAIKEYLPSDVAVRLDGTTVQAKSRNDSETFEWGLTRFLDEAKALAKFENVPAVVRVYDYLQANGTAYMVMALVEGETLSAVYARERTLSQARLMAILLPMLEGLDAVHRANVLHRDIKPSNIVLRPDGSPVLLDFGAARSALGDKSRSMTAVFTPGYAPFEQYMSAGRQGPWTDIYALAATLYHGVTGRVPPPAAERVYEDPMPPAAQAGAGRYDGWFLAAIDRGLAVQEKMRPQSIGQWRALFQLNAPQAAVAPTPAPTALAHAQAGPKQPRSRRGLLIGGGVAGLAAMAAVAAFALSGGSNKAPSPDLVLSANPNTAENHQDRARRLAEEAQKAADEARRAQAAAEAEAKRQADLEQRQLAEAKARQQADDEARQRALAEAKRRNDEAQRAADEQTRRAAEEEARKLATEEARRRAEADARAEAERKAAEEARRKIEVELAEARRQADEARRIAEDLRQKADAERKIAEESKKSDDETAKKAAEAKKKAEDEAKKKADSDAKAKADSEAKKKAEDEAKKKAEDEAKKKVAAAPAPAPQIAAAPAPNAGQADAAAYLVRHDGALRAALEREIKSNSLGFGFKAEIRQMTIGKISLLEARTDSVVVNVPVVMLGNNGVGGLQEISRQMRVVVRGYPNSVGSIVIENASATSQPSAASANDPAQYLAKHWPTLKTEIERDVLANPRKYQTRGISPGSAQASLVRTVSQDGDTVIILVRVRMQSRDGQNSDGADVRVTVKGFPDSARFVETN